MNSPQYSSLTESHSIDLNEGPLVPPKWIQHQQVQSPVAVQQPHYIPQLTPSFSAMHNVQHPAQMSIPIQPQPPILTTSYPSPQIIPQSRSESPYNHKNRSPRHRSRKSSSGSPRRSSRRHTRSDHRNSFDDETDYENHKRRNRSTGRHEKSSRSRSYHHRRKSHRDSDSEDSYEYENSYCTEFIDFCIDSCYAEDDKRSRKRGMSIHSEPFQSAVKLAGAACLLSHFFC